jgi:hypothetical protein
MFYETSGFVAAAATSAAVPVPNVGELARFPLKKV